MARFTLKKAAVSHHEAEVRELRADPERAVAYLKAAMASLDDPEDRAAGYPGASGEPETEAVYTQPENA